MYLDSIYENQIQTFSMVEKLKVYSRNIHFPSSLLSQGNNNGSCPYFICFRMFSATDFVAALSSNQINFDKTLTLMATAAVNFEKCPREFPGHRVFVPSSFYRSQVFCFPIPPPWTAKKPGPLLPSLTSHNEA